MIDPVTMAKMDEMIDTAIRLYPEPIIVSAFGSCEELGTDIAIAVAIGGGAARLREILEANGTHDPRSTAPMRE